MAYSAEFREAVTQGWIQDFPKGGFRPAIRKAGGGGGGGGGGRGCCPLQARYE